MDTHHKTDKRRTRRTFSPEFKAEAVRLCKVGDRSIARVAMDLDLIETSLREWVQRANIDAGKVRRPRSQRTSGLSSHGCVVRTNSSSWSANFQKRRQSSSRGKAHEIP